MGADEILEKVLEETRESRAGLAKTIGLQPHRLQDIARGKSKEFPYEVADKIVSAYPQFSKKWLLTGEGEMLVKQRPTNEATILPPEQQHWIEVPLVPYEAMAGELGWYSDVFPDQLYEKRMVLVEPGTSAKDHVVFTVSGDSMEPKLEKGDEILAKLVPADYYKDTRLHIDRYNVWVVVTRSEGIIIKKIIRHDVANHTLTLHSLNPLYADFNVDLADVAMIYHAVSLSRKNL